MSEVYTKRRLDGWPLCPKCGEDELWSPTYDEAGIVGCDACSWTSGKRLTWLPVRSADYLDDLRTIAASLPPVYGSAWKVVDNGRVTLVPDGRGGACPRCLAKTSLLRSWSDPTDFACTACGWTAVIAMTQWHPHDSKVADPAVMAEEIAKEARSSSLPPSDPPSRRGMRNPGPGKAPFVPNWAKAKRGKR